MVLKRLLYVSIIMSYCSYFGQLCLYFKFFLIFFLSRYGIYQQFLHNDIFLSINANMFQKWKIAVALCDMSNYILLKKSITANRRILNILNTQYSIYIYIYIYTIYTGTIYIYIYIYIYLFIYIYIYGVMCTVCIQV